MSAVEALIKTLPRLPEIPEVALRAQEMLRDQDVHMGKLADLIALDPVLSMRICRLADSPLYGASSASLSMRQAIQRLGLRETRRVVMTVAVMNAVPELPEPMDMRAFWRLGLGSALVGQRLAEDVKYPRPEWAYLAGLVHTLGEATLAINRPQEFMKAFKLASERHSELYGALREVFGVSPAELTAHMLELWGFPAEIREAVAFYLDAPAAPEQRLLASILFAADRMCRGLGCAPEGLGEGDEEWHEKISDELRERLQQIGFEDAVDYLLMRMQFMTGVEDTLSQTFA